MPAIDSAAAAKIPTAIATGARRRAAIAMRQTCTKAKAEAARQSRAGPSTCTRVTSPGPKTASVMLPNPSSNAIAAQTPR